MSCEPSLWKSVIVNEKLLDANFIQLALSRGCKTLHLKGSEIRPPDVEYTKSNQLKVLDLENFQDDTSMY